MNARRRPKEPVTLAERILHIDGMMAGADSLADVELPADLWLSLVDRAEQERDAAARAAVSPTEPAESIAEVITEFSRVPPAVEAWKETGKMRLLLASGDGCILTLDEGFDLAASISRACGGALPEQRQPPKAKSPRVGSPTIVETANNQRAEACGRRLNGAGWKRAAKKAREENSYIVCHHCGAGSSDDTGGLSHSYAIEEDGVPVGTFCHECRQRLRANPREWDRHTAEPSKKPAPAKKPAKSKPGAQATLDEAISNAPVHTTTYRERKPKAGHTVSPRVKFPLGTGPTEKCTQCGRDRELHDGRSRCPAQQHGAVVPGVPPAEVAP